MYLVSVGTSVLSPPVPFMEPICSLPRLQIIGLLQRIVFQACVVAVHFVLWLNGSIGRAVSSIRLFDVVT